MPVCIAQPIKRGILLDENDEGDRIKTSCDGMEQRGENKIDETVEVGMLYSMRR